MTWSRVAMRSLGVIESAELELGEGFTVITGETGAGKTMVVTALGLLRGDRADAALVRHGSAQARVEAVVAASEIVRALVDDAGGQVEGNEVILARTVSAQGRSRAHAGGATVPAALLTQITDELVAVHGQADQHRLQRPAAQRAALDAFAGDEFGAALAEYREIYDQWRSARQRLLTLRQDAAERTRELERVRFGLDECAAVEPQRGEDVTLRAETDRLTHAEALVQAALQAQAALGGDDDGAARDRAVAAGSALNAVAGHDSELDLLGDRVREVTVLLDDLAVDLGGYAQGVEQDPARLAVVQERRAALAFLMRKYGPGLEDVLAWQAEAAVRAAELADDDETIDALAGELALLDPQVRDQAAGLTRMRRAAADRLAELVAVELHDLSMPSARIEVQIDSDREPTAYGVDEVEFGFSANSGAPLRPLHKAASGGELSRVMLALEVVVADRTSVPTFVFDEVDAGIGGKAAVEVGRRLARLASRCQVIAVTHLPQVAAFASNHFRVLKDDNGSVTSSSVVRLSAADRVEELARMLAGQEGSAAAREHARELLDLAGQA